MADQTMIAITEIRAEIGHLTEKVDEQGETSKEILVLLKGDKGTIGLMAKVCLLKQSVKRSWWWLSGVSMGILGIAFWIIKKALTTP